MHPGRRNGGRNADAEEDGARNLAERHSQRAVHHLGGETDQDEWEELSRISEDGLKNIRLHPCLTGDSPTAQLIASKTAVPFLNRLAIEPART